MSVSKQWDIGSSVFSLTDMAVGLIRAATVADVQPAAVLAAEALGSTLIVDPTLIGKAINALDGGKSYRIESIKLQLGISSGGLASEVRKSTPLIRCFLLMSGLRLHLDAREIGELLYELLAQNGLLAITPVSSAQLTALTEALECNIAILLAKESVPVRYFTPLIEHLSSFKDSGIARHAFKPLYQDTAAKLLCNAFLGLRTEDIQRIDLSGLCSGVWISTLLCWLNPGSVDIFTETQELIGGRGSGKISIHLVRPDDWAENADAWEVQQWSFAKDVKALIHLESQGEYIRSRADFVANQHQWNSLGLGIPRSMFYGYVKLSCDYSEESMHVIGEVARGILCAAIPELQLTVVGPNKSRRTKGTKVSFSQICGCDLNHDSDALLRPWGFPITAASSMSSQVRQYLMKSIASAQDDSQTQQLSLYSDFQKFIGTLVAPVKLSFGSDLLSSALHIANTWVVEANHIGDFGSDRAFNIENPGRLRTARVSRYMYASCNGRVEGQWLLMALWGDGLRLDDFMSMSYASSEAGTDQLQSQYVGGLVQSNRGHVIFPKALLDYSTDPRDSLALVVVPGNLEWRGSKYKSLEEERRPQPLIQQNQGNLIHYNFISADNKFVQPRPAESGDHEVKLHVALGSAVLILRAEIVNISNGAKVQYSISQAQMNLCQALRPMRSDRSLAALEEELRLKPILVWRRGPTDHFEDPLHGRTVKCDDPIQDHGTRSILTYTGDPAVDFLRASAVGWLCPIVLQGDVSILECIMQAEETFGNRWTILAEP